MKILIVGAGVIGTVYGAHLAAAGNEVCVVRHGSRTDEVDVSGLRARNVNRGTRTDAAAAVVPEASRRTTSCWSRYGAISWEQHVPGSRR